MKKFRTMFLFLAAAILSFVAPLSIARADSPPPPSYFYSYATNTAYNVKYTEILVKINKTSKFYTDLNTSNANTYDFNSSTPIVTYNQDGYMSISFHCKNVYSEKDVLYEELGMCKVIELNNAHMPISTMTDSIKIALLDKNGNILKISDAVSVKPSVSNTYPNEVKYDAHGTTPKVNFVQYYKSYANNAVIISFSLILAFLIRMAISTAIETLIAIPFKIKPIWKIIVINIATQILLFLLIASGRLDYTAAVIVGEIFVFISEFVAYIFLFKHISKPKLALYTVIANASSLAVGLILNCFHILVG
jgi:hypothetical protein